MTRFGMVILTHVGSYSVMVKSSASKSVNPGLILVISLISQTKNYLSYLINLQLRSLCLKFFF
jgi:hypothetical protein